MALDLWVKDREQAEEWDGAEVGEGEGWEEISLGEVPVETAFAPVAGQRFPTRWVFLAMT